MYTTIATMLTYACKSIYLEINIRSYFSFSLYGNNGGVLTLPIVKTDLAFELVTLCNKICTSDKRSECNIIDEIVEKEKHKIYGFLA